MPVFRGQRDQYGAGFGNFLGRMFRGIWDFVRPAAGAAASQAIRSAAEGVAAGIPLRDIAKSTLAQTTGAAMHGVGLRDFKAHSGWWTEAPAHASKEGGETRTQSA